MNITTAIIVALILFLWITERPKTPRVLDIEEALKRAKRKKQ